MTLGWVDTQALKRLLAQIGAEDLWHKHKSNFQGNQIENLDRRDLIEDLFRNHGEKFRLEELAEIFNVTTQLVSQSSRIPKPPFQMDALRREEYQQRIDQLSRTAGRKQVDDLMRRATRDNSFWTRHGLNTRRVLEELGFPKFSMQQSNWVQFIWREMVRQGIIHDENQAGIILRYGLGIDLAKYVHRNYGYSRWVNQRRIYRDLLDKTKKAGLIEFSFSTFHRHYRDTMQ